MQIELSEEAAERLKKMAEDDSVEPVWLVEALIAVESEKRAIRKAE